MWATYSEARPALAPVPGGRADLEQPPSEDPGLGSLPNVGGSAVAAEAGGSDMLPSKAVTSALLLHNPHPWTDPIRSSHEQAASGTT